MDDVTPLDPAAINPESLADVRAHAGRLAAENAALRLQLREVDRWRKFHQGDLANEQRIARQWAITAATLEAERDESRAQVEAVRALTGGPFSDGYRPYAVEVDGEVILTVGLDDLRAALDGP